MTVHMCIRSTYINIRKFHGFHRRLFVRRKELVALRKSTAMCVCRRTHPVAIRIHDFVVERPSPADTTKKSLNVPHSRVLQKCSEILSYRCTLLIVSLINQWAIKFRQLTRFSSVVYSVDKQLIGRHLRALCDNHRWRYLCESTMTFRSEIITFRDEQTVLLVASSGRRWRRWRQEMATIGARKGDRAGSHERSVARCAGRRRTYHQRCGRRRSSHTTCDAASLSSINTIIANVRSALRELDKIFSSLGLAGRQPCGWDSKRTPENGTRIPRASGVRVTGETVNAKRVFAFDWNRMGREIEIVYVRGRHAAARTRAYALSYTRTLHAIQSFSQTPMRLLRCDIHRRGNGSLLS